MVSKTAVAPLDRVKILLQGHNHHHTSHGVLGGFRHVITREGVLALYKVNTYKFYLWHREWLYIFFKGTYFTLLNF